MTALDLGDRDSNVKMAFLRNRYSLQNPTNAELVMAEFKTSVKQKIVNAIKDLQVANDYDLAVLKSKEKRILLRHLLLINPGIIVYGFTRH